MSRIRWRWNERDFGFRFRQGSGKKQAEYYQAAETGAYYSVPRSHCKLDKAQLEALEKLERAPAAPRVVVNPWLNYSREWDWIQTDDGISLNYAGCLDREEINRREDEGVSRAMESVLGLLERPTPAAITESLLRQIHRDLLGDIYPFAGEWRKVSLHKGDGPTKWPLPPGGIQPLVDVMARNLWSKTPFLSDDDNAVFAFVSEVMNELIALHPFREGNGRTAFIVGNLILMQNDMVPLDNYDRKRDEARYLAACESGRVHVNYTPLAKLLAEWEATAVARWEASHGG